MERFSIGKRVKIIETKEKGLITAIKGPYDCWVQFHLGMPNPFWFKELELFEYKDLAIPGDRPF